MHFGCVSCVAWWPLYSERNSIAPQRCGTAYGNEKSVYYVEEPLQFTHWVVWQMKSWCILRQSTHGSR